MFILNSLIIFLQRLSIKMFAFDIKNYIINAHTSKYVFADRQTYVYMYVCMFPCTYNTLLHNATCATALIRE